MLDQSLRSYKEQVMLPVAARVSRGIHPTTISVIAAIIGLGAGVAGWQQFYGLALVLWLANRVLDGLDGTLARYTNQQSDLGGYIDIMLDNLVYSAIVLLLAMGINTTAAYIAAGVLLVSYYVNASSWMYLSSLLEKRAQGAKSRGEMTSVRMPAGLIEGTETVVVYILFFLLPNLLVPLFWIFAALVAVTTIQRVIWASTALD